MALQHGRELAAALVIGGATGLRREARRLAQRQADRDDDAQAAGQEADDGVVERRHALVDAALLQPVDGAPAQPQQGRRQRHHDQRHQRQDVDAEGHRSPAAGHVSCRRRLDLAERRRIVARGYLLHAVPFSIACASDLVELDHVGLVERLAQLLGEAVGDTVTL